MQAENKRWVLFGLDLVPLWHYCLAGWRELLWGNSTGIRRRLEAPVALEDADTGETQFFVAEHPVEEPGPNTARVGLPAFLTTGFTGKLLSRLLPADTIHPALKLPADLALVRTLTLPSSLETELDAAMTLEVQANSPFLAEDTCCGWTIYKREGELLHVALVIAAISDVHAHLSRHGYSVVDQPPASWPEIWCVVPNVGPVVLQGFGEHHRQADYRRRLCWMGGVAAYIVAVMLAVLAVPGLVRQMQVDNMAGHLAEAQIMAAEAMALRDNLATDNQRIAELQKLIDSQVDHRALLDHLADQAGDDIYMQQVDIDGERVRLRGWAVNAAGFMQQLTQDPSYAEVKAPSGIRRDARAQREQFVIELRLDRQGFESTRGGSAPSPAVESDA